MMRSGLTTTITTTGVYRNQQTNLVWVRPLHDLEKISLNSVYLLIKLVV